jgi:DNA-binding transcriptional regulator YdaS (Cro superfamily)
MKFDSKPATEIVYEWISVNDRLPPPETKVIVRRSTGEVLPDSLRDTVYAIDWYRENKADGKYTHWTPLPE